jgi:hypothetical protein
MIVKLLAADPPKVAVAPWFTYTVPLLFAPTRAEYVIVDVDPGLCVRIMDVPIGLPVVVKYADVDPINVEFPNIVVVICLPLVLSSNIKLNIIKIVDVDDIGVNEVDHI